ncbi:MAG TPA: hypothetical protein PL110_20405 [Candidatus Eremiobacteraeota bacterium]|nr:MAG: hypothetical protein BWY64_03038 [bacterium ADurb.Bin363]HPZ10464.1 hypothetical protein [Candidatus Eremiobacteraeota bacterium]
MGPVLSIAGMVINGISSLASPPPPPPTLEMGVRPNDYSIKEDTDITGFRDAEKYDITGFNDPEDEDIDGEYEDKPRIRKDESITGF